MTITTGSVPKALQGNKIPSRDEKIFRAQSPIPKQQSVKAFDNGDLCAHYGGKMAFNRCIYTGRSEN